MMVQVVAATGQVLLHRFYCKQSMTDFDVKVRLKTHELCSLRICRRALTFNFFAITSANA